MEQTFCTFMIEKATMTEPITLRKPFFFMMGLVRSGTTLTQAIINANNSVCLSSECNWLPDFYNGYQLYRSGFSQNDQYGWDAAVQAMHAQLFKGLGMRFGLLTRGHRNCIYARQILEMFPAKVLHMIRDPRDSFTSALRTGTHTSFQSFREAYEHVCAATAIDYLSFRYEDLMSDAIGTIRELCDFLDVAYTEQMITPLTQKISRCDVPVITDVGDLTPNPSVFHKWKRVLQGEDLVDLNEYYGLMRSLAYEVWDEQAVSVTIIADGEVACSLNGMSLTTNGQTRTAQQRFEVDIHSLGAVAVQFDDASPVKQVTMEGHGSFYRSRIDEETFIFDFADLASRDTIYSHKFYTFASLVEHFDIGPSSRIALYPAGGATQAFLKEYYRKNLDRKYSVVTIIDSTKTGWIGSIPIVRFKDIDMGEFDCIIVTSLPFYKDISDILMALGLREGIDFVGAMFPNQDIVKWW